MSHYLWDYDEDELKKSGSGQLKILERKINYGPPKGEKISRSEVKKYWNELEPHLFENQRELFRMLLFDVGAVSSII